MSKGIMPDDPNRADHRFIAYTLKNFVKPKCVHFPEEFDKVSRAFTKAGGSWERIFKGSARDIVLLRRLLKLAAKHGILTKEPSFR
jgi:hypothetical protein